MPFIILIFLLLTCPKSDYLSSLTQQTAGYRIKKSITYNHVNVDVIIDKPAGNEFDVLVVYHGTVFSDNKLLAAANYTLDQFKKLLIGQNMMIVSVAYPEENLLMGDNLVQSEAALLWVKERAKIELGVGVKKIFLAGHSQGGYIVTRLNTLHQTNGVIANAPGPLNLVYRCQLEEKGQAPKGITCTLLKNTYGSASTNPDAYFQRSLLNFTNGFKADILFIQGLKDSPIQLYTWPIFKGEVNNCANCKSVQFLELANFGHTALFESTQAKTEFNRFIQER